MGSTFESSLVACGGAALHFHNKPENFKLKSCFLFARQGVIVEIKICNKMKTSTLLAFLLLFEFSATSQCLTDFTKLVPEPTLDYTLNYGSTFSLYDNYLAIGLPAHDSLGRITGLVYVYENLADGWRKIATLAPSDPVDALQFGQNVVMSSDYILVSASSITGGKVYLFKKPATGWQTDTELTSFTYPNTEFFGVPWYRGLNTPVDISDDQQTIAIGDMWYEYDSGRPGAVFVYHKQPLDEWDGNMEPAIIRAPEDGAADFSRPGVAIQGDRVITGTPYGSTGSGKLYIYRDPSGEFSDLQLEATLTGPAYPGSFWLGYYRFICTDEGIFSAMATNLDADSRIVIAYFEKPASGDWSDAIDATCTFAPGAGIPSTNLPLISWNGTALVVSYHTADGDGYTTLVKKGPSGWYDPIYENVDHFVPVDGQIVNHYGSNNAASEQHVAIAQLPHPDNPQANLSLKVLSHNPDDTWASELLYPRRQTTAGHAYGRAILGFEDFLFVGAPYDGTVKIDAGAVYIYRKTGGVWAKAGKILSPVDEPNDNVFGTAIATNGVEVAIGAAGFGEHGRVFIYRKKEADWSDVELVQEIELPENMLTVFAYGDNVAMSDEWLLIPYVQNAPARIMLAIYHNNGSQWEFSQVVEMGGASVFAKFTTKAVAIEGETIVAGNIIFEPDSDGRWWPRCTLSPSDPELAQVAPDFSHWVRNGDMFGNAVAISDNSIFIGAPNKDYGDTWDVGAIYVFTKKPWESWSSRTESAKVLPRVKEERELFGYSLKVFGNTLLGGAPGADYNVDGTARNKPGRAYVFQTEDYFWQTVTPLLDFTGDSFVKDYFGITVALDETDFFIGAPIEDIETGRLSGSVYVTPAPPIVKLVAPVCSTESSIDLFGYPFGGAWSGPGLIDAAEGTFDPAVAGIGEHVFTYKTESCTYEGKLRITVEAPVQATLKVEPEQLVCENATFIDVPLSVEDHDGYQYLWYHRDNGNEPFFPLNAEESTLSAAYRGEYKAKVFNEVCAAFSPIVTIRNEEVELTLDSLDRICQDSGEGIALSATPAGGTWSGAGVRDNRFFSQTLSNGKHTILYTYVSKRGCPYNNQISVEIDRVPVPEISRMEGNLCSEGEVNLEMTTSAKEEVTYTWQQKPVDGTGFSSLEVHSVTLTAGERGTYRLEAADGDCVVHSNTVAVDDRTFEFTMNPDGESATTCDGVAQLLTISPAAGRTYEWYFSAFEDSESVLIASGPENTFNADSTGYYFAVVHAGKCKAESPHKSVTVRKADEISFPNIVTPNGDAYNETFVVETNTEILGVYVVNRYGKTIYSGTRPENWDIHDVTPGIYFPVVTYKTCGGQIDHLKGIVQVMK